MISPLELAVSYVCCAVIGAFIGYLVYSHAAHIRVINAREDGYRLGLLDSDDYYSSQTFVFTKRPFDWNSEDPYLKRS